MKVWLTLIYMVVNAFMGLSLIAQGHHEPLTTMTAAAYLILTGFWLAANV